MKFRISGLAAAVVLALLAGILAPAISGGATPAPTASGPAASVIVRTAPGAEAGVGAFVTRSGGRVTDEIDMIGALVCEVPASVIGALRTQPGVVAVTADGTCGESGSREYRWTPDDDTAGTPAPTNTFLATTRVQSVWRLKRDRHAIDGRGVTIAVIDSGVTDGADFRAYDDLPESSCIKKSVVFDPTDRALGDGNGHGTHVAGIAVGDGSAASSRFGGVAPGANLINLKVSGADAQATEADVLKALQWVYDNREAYNIRVLNLSLNSDVAQSYKESPIDAACEILWFNGVVVVASAGNSGPNGVTLSAAPANDPFIITVGATDEQQSKSRSDDTVAPFSAYGRTADGYVKPDLYAPGRNIYSTLSEDSVWATEYPERLDPSGKYFRMSGTSVSAPVVAGTAALMLQYEPSLTPDQVKNRLVQASGAIADPAGVRRPYLDAYSAVTSTDMRSANTGLEVSTLLTTGEESILTGSVMWNSVMWNSVMWNSVMWNSGETLACQSVMWH